MTIGKLGRREPKNAPALLASSFLRGALPAHPPVDDYAKPINDWQVLGNDQYGDCVAVAWANLRHIVTTLSGDPAYPTLDQVLAFYRTQNPGFPSQDDGMEIQTALEYLVTHGGPDGVKAVAFAKLDPHNVDELRAAAHVFKSIIFGITVLAANETEFDAGKPWDYVRGSQNLGGHGIAATGYQPNIGFVTWGAETSFTDAFVGHLLDEAWVVIFPEHFNDPEFEQLIDVNALAANYLALTGKTLVVPNQPPLPPPPDPGAAPFLGARDDVAKKLVAVARRSGLTVTDYMNRHWAKYFGLPK